MMRINKTKLICCAALLLALAIVCTSALAADPIRIKQQGSNKKWGYVDEAGSFAIKAQYISASEFSNGYAVVQVSKNNYAVDQYIDYNGKVVIKPISSSKYLYSFNEWQGDYGVVEIWEKQKNGSITPIGYNYVGKNGKLFNDTVYHDAYYFKEGFALVGTGTRPYGKMNRMSVAGVHHYMGTYSGNTPNGIASSFFFIDKSGKQLSNNKWAAARSFNEGMAAVAIKGVDGSLMWGFVNATGELAVSPIWTKSKDFASGYAAVFDGKKWGFINAAGEQVIPCTWDDVGNFTADGLAKVKSGDLYGYINAENTIVIEPAFAACSDFMDGKAIVSDGVVQGAIDASGKYVISPMYRSVQRMPYADYFYAAEFSTPIIINENGELITAMLIDGKLPSEEQIALYPAGTPCKLFKIPLAGAGFDTHVFVSESGQILSSNLFSDIQGTSFTIAHGSGKTSVFTLDGTPISENKWDGVNGAASTNERICILQNNLFGFVDQTGKTVIIPQYSSAEYIGDGQIAAWVGSNRVIIDGISPETRAKQAEEAAAEKALAMGDASQYDTLKPGSKGQAVLDARMKLYELGYFNKKPTQTEYTNNMMDYVKKFEKDNGLTQDGILSAEDQAVLFSL